MTTEWMESKLIQLDSIAKRVQNLRAELAGEEEAADPEEPEDPGPYAGAYAIQFTRTYNGLLTPNELDEMKASWIEAIERIKPTTKKMHVSSGQTTFWVKVGGLKVQQRSRIDIAWNELHKHWWKVAAARAMNERQAAGWTGPNNLTSPGGKQKGPNGQYFGDMTRP